MLRKIIKLTKSESCSCSKGKPCDGCKHKRVIKPQVYIEEPRRLTVPVTITRFGHRPVTTVKIANRNEPPASGPRTTLCQWYRRRKALSELKKYQEQAKKLEYERLKRVREAEIIKLYQKNQIEKAKLDIERKKQEYEIQKAQREREAEVYELLRRQAEAEAALEPVKPYRKPTKIKKIQEKFKKIKVKKAPKERKVDIYEEPLVKKTKTKKIKIKKIKIKKEKKVKEKKVKPQRDIETKFYDEPEPVKITKPKKIKIKKIKIKKVKEKKIKVPKERKLKEKTISAKPKAQSHYASVKIRKRGVIDSLGVRFVNCCYRCCCQFYCWMTIILVVGLFLILYL